MHPSKVPGNIAHSTLAKQRGAAMTKTKLCGYLRKKRNKVGGWRKMWFVLQDKLLLSYGSKEEYENKLVSFKDVVNLVPGTVVRPLGGFRFTIETTSQTVYTFHCDDRAAYREWITMLLFSLTAHDGVNAVTSKAEKALSLVERLGDISLNYVPSAFAAGVRCATSCTSIDELDGAKSAKSGASCVRLPIAQNTAKILERNGVNAGDSNRATTTETSRTSCYACIQQHPLHDDLKHNSELISTPKPGNKDMSDLKIVGKNKQEAIPSTSASVGQEQSRRATAQPAEPVYAIVDLKSKYAHRRMRQLMVKRCSSYESIEQTLCCTEPSQAREREMSSRPSSSEASIEAICEDNDSFHQQNPVEEENIYEAVNVPAARKNNSFLACFNRLRITSLHQLNRFRNRNSDCSCSKRTSQGGDIFNKNTSNRKSIKARMRKLCFRGYEPKPFFKPNQPVVMAPAKKLKPRWKSVKLSSKNQNLLNDATKPNLNKRFFGSLPHLKKPRVSLFSSQHFQSSGDEGRTN